MSEQIKEILEKISYCDGTFPRKELQFLIDNRDESTPYLLDSIRAPEEVLGKLVDDGDYFLPIYVLLILAQFREKQAYQLVFDIFSSYGKTVDAAFDDFIVEELSRVLASVSGGDVSLINRLAEDESVNEYVRVAATDAWMGLLHAGLKTRDEVIAYYKSLLHRTYEEESLLYGSIAWKSLSLKARELLPEIEKGYANNHIDPMLMGDWKEFQELMAQEESGDIDLSDDAGHFIDDTISYLEGWYCFTGPVNVVPKAKEAAKIAPGFMPEQNPVWDSDREGTFVRETPKVGKNDPCPCGSGRKYKKCCFN